MTAEVNKSRLDPKKDKWDEICILVLMQTEYKKQLELPPSTRLVCFSKSDPKRKYITTKEYSDAIQHIKEMSIFKRPPETKLHEDLKIYSEHLPNEAIGKVVKPPLKFFETYITYWKDGTHYRFLKRFYDDFTVERVGKVSNQLISKWQDWINK